MIAEDENAPDFVHKPNNLNPADKQEVSRHILH